MHLTSRDARTRRQVGRRVLAMVAAFGLAACAVQEKAAGPVLPPPPPDNPQLLQAAFIAHVNTTNGHVEITSPQTTVNGFASAPARSGLGGPSFSLVAGDAISLTASNFTASAVGAFTPGKIRVAFDLSITNKLSSVQLINPTFPPPPPGVQGILMFPFATHVTVTTGGVSVGGSGDSVIVELPNFGAVAPSVDWNGDGTAGSGAAFNFFNDTGCPAGSNDCYRWEAFAQPLAAGATTLARTVGFDIDPTVANFSAKMIIAADLQNSGPAPTGTVAGSVTSAQRGALSGVLVTTNPGGLVATTSGTGAYSIANVNTGPKTVTLSNLPSGCTDPGSQATTVSQGVTSTVNFTVVCTAPAGTVNGTITRSGTGTQSLDGTLITATPAAAGTTPGSTTLAAGALTYSIAGVQIGTGTGAGNGSVALSNLPSGCTSAAGSYTGLVLGGTATVNFTVNCAAPAALYQYRAVWGTPGTQVTLTLSFDPSTLNSPTVNGAGLDDFNSFQAVVSYSATRLGFVSCANAAGSSFQNINANGGTPGQINLLNFLNGPGATTQQAVAVCTFNVLAGAATTVTTSTSLTAISSFNGDNLIPNTQKNEGTLTLP